MSNWRAMADEALHGENIRNTRVTSPENRPSVPIVPSVPAPIVVLREWQDALTALDPCQPHGGFTIGRWQTLYDCSIWWAESFGKQAAREGWQTSDIFGLLPQRAEWGGLIDRLGDCRGLTLDGECFRWDSTFYGLREYHRGTWPNLTAWWEIGL